MNEEWKLWIKVNLERGCSVSKMRSLLQESGFLIAEIDIEINANLDEDELCVDYNKSAETFIVKNEFAKKIINKSMQMYIFNDFLNDEDCTDMIAQINLNLRPSPITVNAQEDFFRTSRTCDLGLIDCPIIQVVDKKISEALGVTLGWSEAMQGQRYDVGQEFKTHTDYFEPGTSEFNDFAAIRGQRTWTFMVYLNDTIKGGETYFSHIDKTFSPKMGQAVIWNNLLPDGSPNTSTSHCSQPVMEGHKFIITKWFRDKGEGRPFL